MLGINGWVQVKGSHTVLLLTCHQRNICYRSSREAPDVSRDVHRWPLLTLQTECIVVFHEIEKLSQLPFKSKMTYLHPSPWQIETFLKLFIPCYTLDQGSPNFFVRGPHKVIQNMSRVGHPMQCDCCGICYILQNQQIFWKYTVYYFFIIDKTASRAASDLRAVVWRPLH